MRQAVKKSEALARDVMAWQKRLAPKFPDIDAHDMNLILWSLLRRKYGGKLHFLLRRREDGSYVR